MKKPILFVAVFLCTCCMFVANAASRVTTNIRFRNMSFEVDGVWMKDTTVHADFGNGFQFSYWSLDTSKRVYVYCVYDTVLQKPFALLGAMTRIMQRQFADTAYHFSADTVETCTLGDLPAVGQTIRFKLGANVYGDTYEYLTASAQEGNTFFISVRTYSPDKSKKIMGQIGNSLDVKSPQFEEDIIEPKLDESFKMPSFRGGQQALFRFLSEEVRYPILAMEQRVQARVICSFVVDRDGSITDISVSNISHISAGRQESRKEAILLSDLTSAEIKAVEALVAEAMRVIKAMPKWKPGTQDGKPMRVRYTIPINFRF
ncbi:MAG: energy transducer TonB [Paludibacteraceae bacterium]